MNREIDHCRSLPYGRTVEFVEDESGSYYLAGIREIPGIGGDGDTPEEALRDLDAAFEAYVSVCLEDGLEIPEPAQPRTATGGR